MPGPGYSFFGEEEERSVLEVLRAWRDNRDVYDGIDGFPTARRFEDEVRRAFDSPYCVSVNSGTSALLAALAALGVGPGDEVIVPGYLFVACLGAVAYSGATPVLAEIDESLTLDPKDVRQKVTPNTRAIMAVHMLGGVCDLGALEKVARDCGAYLLEDAAQACGGEYRGRRVGTIGDAGAFSLNPFKVITAGDGGFVLTRDERTFQRTYAFSDHGWLPYRDDDATGDLLFGVNVRMSELTAALAIAQLGKLDGILARCRRLGRRLTEMVGERPGVRQRSQPDADGDCGAAAVYVFDRVQDAVAVADIIGVRRLVDSPKHYYAGLPALPALAAGGREGPVPFQRHGHRPSQQMYRAGALPRTDDLLARSLALSVGLSDSYLGPGFGLTAHSDDHTVEQVAERFRLALGRVLG